MCFGHHFARFHRHLCSQIRFVIIMHYQRDIFIPSIADHMHNGTRISRYYTTEFRINHKIDDFHIATRTLNGQLQYNIVQKQHHLTIEPVH